MRRVLFSAAAVCLMFGFVPFVQAQETKAIIEKATKAHGGAAKLAKQQAAQTKTKGELEIMGLTLKFTEETHTQTDRLKSHVELDVNGMNVTVDTVYNGKEGWVVAQGNTVKLTDEQLVEIKEALSMSRLMRLAFLNDKNVELSALGEAKVNGKPAVGLKIAAKGHKEVNIYFDKETGLVAKVERQAVDQATQAEVAEERIIEEYQEVEGLKVPKRVLVNRGGKKYMQAEVVEMKFHDKFDDSVFAKP